MDDVDLEALLAGEDIGDVDLDIGETDDAILANLLGTETSGLLGDDFENQSATIGDIDDVDDDEVLASLMGAISEGEDEVVALTAIQKTDEPGEIMGHEADEPEPTQQIGGYVIEEEIDSIKMNLGKIIANADQQEKQFLPKSDDAYINSDGNEGKSSVNGHTILDTQSGDTANLTLETNSPLTVDDLSTNANTFKVEIMKAAKPMGFGIKFGTMGAENLIDIDWPGKDEDPQMANRETYIVVSSCKECAEGIDNPALEAGIQSGDIVIMANGMAVFTNADLKTASKRGGKVLELVLARLPVFGGDLYTTEEAADEENQTSFIQNVESDPRDGVDDDIDQRLNELGVHFNIDVGLDGIDLSCMDDTEILSSGIMVDGSEMLTGNCHTYTVIRRPKFGFGILFALAPIDKFDFDFDGKDQRTECMIVNRFKDVPNGIGENPAQAAGLKEKDIILSINGVDVYDNAQVAAALKKQKNNRHWYRS
jgi:hypothetical protein